MRAGRFLADHRFDPQTLQAWRNSPFSPVDRSRLLTAVSRSVYRSLPSHCRLTTLRNHIASCIASLVARSRTLGLAQTIRRVRPHQFRLVSHVKYGLQQSDLSDYLANSPWASIKSVVYPLTSFR